MSGTCNCVMKAIKVEHARILQDLHDRQGTSKTVTFEMVRDVVLGPK